MPQTASRRISLTLALLIAGMACVALPSFAQDAKAVELRYAAGAPPRSVWGQQVERFAKAVEEESKGTVKIQPFLGGQLGSDVEIIQQVARGRLDMAGVPVPFAAMLLPELQLVSLPTYYRSAEELDCVMDAGLMADIEQRLAGKGLKVVSWGESGAVDFIGKRAFASPEELAGIKAATSGMRMGVLMWEAFKSNPATVPAPEMAAGFQTGLVDVGATVPVFYVASGLNKVAPVMTRSDLFFVPSFNLMNKASWDRLNPSQQAAIERARQRTGLTQQRQEVRAFQAQMRDAHVKGGGQLVELSAAQRDAFRRVMEPMWPRMVAEAGPQGAAFFAVMDASRKGCAK